MEGEKSAHSSHQTSLPPVTSLSTPTISQPSSEAPISKTPIEIAKSESSKQEQKTAPDESTPLPVISIDIGIKKSAVTPSVASEAESKRHLLPLAHPFSPFPSLPLHPCQTPLVVIPIATVAGASPSLDTRTLDNGKLEALGESEADGERTEREHKKRSKNWTRQETLRLIKLRTELEPRFAKSGRKTELWDEIAESMQKERISRDAQQCRDKWEKLSARYKEVRDGLKDREDNPFFDDLHPLLADKSVKRERERDRFVWGKDKETLGREDGADAQATTAKDVEREAEGDREEVTGDGWEEDDEDTEIRAPARKKRKGLKYIAVTDLAVVQSLLESVISKQQKFFRDLLEAMEKREQIREQLRQEKEEKWRAEERAQRCVFNNAMILLTQRLVGERMGTAGAGPATVPPSSPDGPQGPKRRSKNWKRTEVLQLIKVRGSMESRFQSSTRRTGLWEEVAELLIAEGIKRDAKQCREKWDKLIAAYKDVADGKRERGDSPYFTELTAIIGSKPTETG
ncbi:hypothetical protein O6H91_08G045200 [Diphasiastrum complanatum]|uniref:Uncharacterized protein n=1 Tax=Diphasiastrum complanatum TaxID=34168 RepID=A0ACC2CY22_DIPCM|nr:hypothetical protein O6H91_Y207400 [Diphasiastrum complanatum]KAJ7546572.1 hypothetical protein O6H91_08G045200 [Diphasiastrum complanatum]